MKMGATAAGLLSLLAAYVVGQQISGQLDRPGTQQRDRSAIRQTDRNQSDRVTTEYGQRDLQARAGAHSQEVEKYLANCLVMKNQGEIELAQLAQERAQNPEVKQFAQKMVQDHSKFAQHLQQLTGGASGAGRTPGATTPGGARQFDAQANASDSTQLPGSPGARQPNTQDLNENVVGTAQLQPQSGGLQQLAQIERQIAERCKQAIREDLEQKSGAEFDKAYVGTQIGAHIHMLAALEVIGQQGQGQLAQLAQQAQPTVQQHLDHAKQLIQQLDQGGRTGVRTQAERPSRTQRE
jgi:predicted outer membrane protein